MFCLSPRQIERDRWGKKKNRDNNGTHRKGTGKSKKIETVYD